MEFRGAEESSDMEEGNDVTECRMCKEGVRQKLHIMKEIGNKE